MLVAPVSLNFAVCVARRLLEEFGAEVKFLSPGEKPPAGSVVLWPPRCGDPPPSLNGCKLILLRCGANDKAATEAERIADLLTQPAKMV